MNKEDFTHVNWDTEIDCDETLYLSEKELKHRSSDAIMCWTLMQDHIQRNVGVNEKEPHKIANSFRMLQYFLGKFLLHHAKVYDREVFSKANSDNYDGLKSFKEAYQNIEESTIPLKLLRAVEQSLIFKCDINRAQRMAEVGTIEDIKAHFKRFAIKALDPVDALDEGDRDTIRVIHDDVNYHISIMYKRLDQRKIDCRTAAEEHRSNIKRYHSIIKPIYEHLKDRGVENPWVMEGGGSQVQMFFGVQSRYLGILYLDSRNSKENSNDYTLVVESKTDLKLFTSMNIEGVSVKPFG